MLPNIITLMPFYALYAYTPAIPKIYWNAKSQEEIVKYLCCEYDKLRHYADALADKENETTQAVNQLTEIFKKFQESGFDDYYFQQIHDWVQENMPNIISEAIKTVYFGLTLDGYFVAYIPKSWTQITFDTGTVYGTPEYGRLILSYDVSADAKPVEQPTIHIGE